MVVTLSEEDYKDLTHVLSTAIDDRVEVLSHVYGYAKQEEYNRSKAYQRVERLYELFQPIDYSEDE